MARHTRGFRTRYSTCSKNVGHPNDHYFRQLPTALFVSSLKFKLRHRISRRDTKGPKCANVVVRVLTTTLILGLKQN